jgi:hypothetical protein
MRRGRRARTWGGLVLVVWNIRSRFGIHFAPPVMTPFGDFSSWGGTLRI